MFLSRFGSGEILIPAGRTCQSFQMYQQQFVNNGCLKILLDKLKSHLMLLFVELIYVMILLLFTLFKKQKTY